MKKIFFSCAIAAATLAICLNNFAGAAPGQGSANTYAANDTIPKKDTVKKDTPSFAFNALDTIPKKDTVKKDTTFAFAFNMLDTIPKKDTVKKDTTAYTLLAKN